MQKNENENDKNKIYSQTIVQGRLTKSEWNNMESPSPQMSWQLLNSFEIVITMFN